MGMESNNQTKLIEYKPIEEHSGWFGFENIEIEKFIYRQFSLERNVV